MDHRCVGAAWALMWLTFAGFPAVAAPVAPSPRPSSSAKPPTPPSRPPNPRAAAIVAARASPGPDPGLYGRHARRLVQAYLRLKLLEMRELDLERARSVIEHRLGPEALLAPSPIPAVRALEARER